MSAATTERTNHATIEVRGLTKDFGHVRAVDDLTFTVQPGRVTGFLGPNGAGKTTTLRILLSLVSATSGTATFGGTDYLALPRPTTQVGAALEAASFHPGRTAREHLRSYAPQAGADTRRVDELLALVGLTQSARRRVGGFSLGMRQRLALATTLLGDPQVLLLDEPANGLDPEGIAWLRSLLRHLAAEGRTVLVSSHVLSEVEQTVDDVVIIAQGRLVHTSTLADLAALAVPVVALRSPDTAGVHRLAAERGWRLAAPDDARRDATGTVHVEGVTPEQVGAAAFGARLEVHELRPVKQSLEPLFLRLTHGANGDGPSPESPPPAAPTPTDGGAA